MKKISRFIPWFIIIPGILLRVREYLSNRSLWVDEALLVNNIIDRNFLELLKPLSIDQHAPVGFLFVERFIFLLFGNSSEYVFRIFPLVCGIVSLFLFKKLAERIFPKVYAYLALAIFAFSDLQIRYSTELKQYSSEVLVQLSLYLLVTKFSLEKLMVKKWWFILAIGSLTLVFSHTAILTLTAFSILTLIQFVRVKNWKKILPQVLIFTVWIIVFAFLYLKDAVSAYTDKAFVNAWPYFNLIPVSFDQVLANIGGFYSIIFDLLGNFSALIGIILFFIGSALWFKKERVLCLLFLLPLILGLIASGLQKYPYVTRVFLYTTPAIILSIIFAAEWLVGKIKGRRKIIVYSVLAISLLIGSSNLASTHLFNPRQIEEFKPALEYYLANREPEDFLYVYYAAESPMKYYAQRYNLNPGEYIIGKMSRNNWIKYISEINSLSSKKRVWFLFYHVIINRMTPNGPIGEEEYILNHLNKLGRLESKLQLTGASIYLYSF